MPTVIAHHDVNDTEHWLASPKREDCIGPLGVTNIRTFVDPQNPTHVAVLMDVPDMDAVMAAMETEGAAPFDILAWLRTPGLTPREWLGWCQWKQQRYQVRLLAAPLPPAAAAAARQRKRQKAQKAGRVLVLTTLPAA